VIIRRRGKNRTSQMIAPPVVEGSPIGQLEKYEGPPLPTRGMGVPEYNPHTSISSTDGSPPTHSPVPPYELGHGQRPHRNELLG
jgi:hypothetical protein